MNRSRVRRIPGSRRRPGHSSKTRPSTRLRKCFASFWRGAATNQREGQLAQLETRLELAGLKPAEALPLIAPLLNLPLPAKYPPSPLSPEQQRRRLLATLVEWVLGAARAQPTVIAIEDLHWADPSTLELLQLLVEQGTTARLLSCIQRARSFTPNGLQRDASHADHAQPAERAQCAHDGRGGDGATRHCRTRLIAAVVERTGGVPLFVEELTRVLAESEGGANANEIPTTLHDSLMARLDRLGPAREVAQFGAVIGREFSYELLHAVHPAPEDQLQTALKAVTDAEMLYVRGIPPAGDLQVQARTDPGRRVRGVAQDAPARNPSTRS